MDILHADQYQNGMDQLVEFFKERVRANSDSLILAVRKGFEIFWNRSTELIR